MAIRELQSPWFVQQIHKYMLKDSKRVSKPGYFRPSSISECARLNLYSFLAVDWFPSIDLQTLKYFQRGTQDHDTWYEIFKEAGIKCRHGRDYKVSHRNPNIRLEWDWAIMQEEGGEEELIDWKSTRSKTTFWGQEVQWNIYAKLTGIHNGWIVKQDPFNWKLTPIPMKYDEKFTNDIFEWLAYIQECAMNEKMIKKDFHCGKDREWGKECSLYEHCWSPIGDNPFDSFPYDRKGNPFLEEK